MGKSQYDIEAIGRDFKSGTLSIREIGRQYGCSDTMVRKWAKKFGWVRDLSADVRKQANANLVRELVRESMPSDDEIIKVAADEQTVIRKLHRKDIASLRALEAKLIEQIYNNPTKLYITQYQGEIVEKVVSLTAAELAQAANNLANVQHKRIALERQAYNINEKSDEDDDKLIIQRVMFCKNATNTDSE